MAIAARMLFLTEEQGNMEQDMLEYLSVLDGIRRSLEQLTDLDQRKTGRYAKTIWIL